MGLWSRLAAAIPRKRPSAPEPYGKTPPAGAVRDIPVSALAGWDNVPRVRMALMRLMDGQFADAADLVEAMLGDDHIGGKLQQRIKALLGRPFDLSGHTDDDDTDPKAQEVAEWAEEYWDDMFPESEVEDLWRWGNFLGVGIGEMVWEQRPDMWLPRLKVWHPRFCYYRKDTKTYWLNTLDGPLEITPGDGKWILFTPFGANRGWVKGLVRQLAIPYLVRAFTNRDWARYNEIHGIPARKGIVPQGAPAEEKKRFARELAALSTESIVMCPVDATGKGFDVQLVEAMSPAGGYEAFDKFLARMEDNISLSILGQTLTSGAKSGGLGTGGVAEVHQDVRQDLLAFDSKALGRTLRDQALKPAAAFNYGDAELAPQPCWEVDPPENMGEQATTLQTLAQAAQTFQGAGWRLDVEKLAERFDVPLHPDFDPDAPMPAPQDPNAPPTDEAAARPPSAPDDSGGGAPTAEQASTHHVAKQAFVDGQLYADAVADDGRDKAVGVLVPDIKIVLAALAGAKDYDDLRRRLAHAYRGMKKPQELAELMRKALVLADLNGRLAVKGEK